MRPRLNWLVGLTAGLVAVMAMVACGKRAAMTPPQIHYGEDACASCGMTIDDPRFASAVIYRAPSGSQKIAIFDDIGCMLAWQREHTADRTIAAFVHDYTTRQWISATGAWYVRSTAIQTPMGWGIAAGEAQTNAEAAAPGSGIKAIGYSQLRSTEQNRHGAAK